MNAYDAICIICGKPVRNVSGGLPIHKGCLEAVAPADLKKKESNGRDK